MKITVPLFVGAAALAMECASQADQPHMQAALQSLQTAKAQLLRADRDKGGHRARAEQLVEQAMAEVRAGIAYDRQHLSPQEAGR
jgi:uncharacterized iron-regulated protein